MNCHASREPRNDGDDKDDAVDALLRRSHAGLACTSQEIVAKVLKFIEMIPVAPAIGQFLENLPNKHGQTWTDS